MEPIIIFFDCNLILDYILVHLLSATFKMTPTKRFLEGLFCLLTPAPQVLNVSNNAGSACVHISGTDLQIAEIENIMFRNLEVILIYQRHVYVFALHTFEHFYTSKDKKSG